MNAYELHSKVRAIRDEMFSMLRADGRIPYEGTDARAEYEKLESEHDRLFSLWAEADKAERNA